jgi:hypothetical protein
MLKAVQKFQINNLFIYGRVMLNPLKTVTL